MTPPGPPTASSTTSASVVIVCADQLRPSVDVVSMTTPLRTKAATIPTPDAATAWSQRSSAANVLDGIAVHAAPSIDLATGTPTVTRSGRPGAATRPG